jgi:hypothetical protein
MQLPSDEIDDRFDRISWLESLRRGGVLTPEKLDSFADRQRKDGQAADVLA